MEAQTDTEARAMPMRLRARARSRIVIADSSVRTLTSVPRRTRREMHHDDSQVLWRQRSRGERVQLGQGNGGRKQALDSRLATAGVLEPVRLVYHWGLVVARRVEAHSVRSGRASLR